MGRSLLTVTSRNTALPTHLPCVSRRSGLPSISLFIHTPHGQSQRPFFRCQSLLDFATRTRSQTVRGRFPLAAGELPVRVNECVFGKVGPLGRSEGGRRRVWYLTEKILVRFFLLVSSRFTEQRSKLFLSLSLLTDAPIPRKTVARSADCQNHLFPSSCRLLSLSFSPHTFLSSEEPSSTTDIPLIGKGICCAFELAGPSLKKGGGVDSKVLLSL